MSNLNETPSDNSDSLTFEGPLKEVLKKFKSDFLQSLTPEQLTEEVRLTIQNKASVQDNNMNETDAEWLKKQIITVIEKADSIEED